MARKKSTHSFVLIIVEGRGALLPFPVDMLRYDASHPAHETDSLKIERTLKDSENPDDYKQISLYCAAYNGPTLARWDSRGWRVVSVDGMPAPLVR